MTANKSPEQVVRAWNDSYSKQDLLGAAKLMSDDFIRLGDSTRWNPIGKQRWIDGQSGFFPAFPDWGWDLLGLLVSGDLVVCEFIEHGTFTKPYLTVVGLEIPPTGESYEDRSSLYFRVNEDGLIAEIRAYYTTNLDRVFHFEAQISEYIAANPGVKLF